MAISTMNLRFLHVFSTLPPTPAFHFKDLPGSGKRIDILCRGLAACFDWGPELMEKETIEYYAVFSDEITLKFTFTVDCSGKGETWWASVMQRVIKGESVEFCERLDWNLETTMKNSIQDGFSLYALEEGGIPLDKAMRQSNSSQNSFMLGDHRGFALDTQELLDDMNVPRVSLGETSYLGSHCIAQVISKYERISN
jgi:tRNA pseudouridine-54 N-methylase